MAKKFSKKMDAEERREFKKGKYMGGPAEERAEKKGKRMAMGGLGRNDEAEGKPDAVQPGRRMGQQVQKPGRRMGQQDTMPGRRLGQQQAPIDQRPMGPPLSGGNPSQPPLGGEGVAMKPLMPQRPTGAEPVRPMPSLPAGTIPPRPPVPAQGLNGINRAGIQPVRMAKGGLVGKKGKTFKKGGKVKGGMTAGPAKMGGYVNRNIGLGLGAPKPISTGGGMGLGLRGGGLARKGVGQALAKGGLAKGAGCAMRGVKKPRMK